MNLLEEIRKRLNYKLQPNRNILNDNTNLKEQTIELGSARSAPPGHPNNALIIVPVSLDSDDINNYNPIKSRKDE